MSIPNHYVTLGIARSASIEDITQAFRRLAQIWHPDRNGEPNAAEMFRGVQAARDALMDAQTRTALDAQLAHAAHQAGGVPKPEEVDYFEMRRGAQVLTTEGWLVRE